jgi:mycothiol system anti-sigma-R factor
VSPTGPRRLTCEEVFDRLDDFLDRQLSPTEQRLVQEHLEACAACASEHRFESHVLDDVRAKLQRIAIPATLQENLLKRLREGSGGA